MCQELYGEPGCPFFSAGPLPGRRRLCSFLNDTHTEGLWTALQLKPESWPRHLSAFYSFPRSERCENISFAQIISTFSAPKKGWRGVCPKKGTTVI